MNTEDRLDIIDTTTRTGWHADQREWDRLIDVFSDPSGPVLTPDYATTATCRPGDAVPVVIAGAAIGTVNVADLLP